MHPKLQNFRPRLSSTTLLLTSCALLIAVALFAIFPAARTEAKPKIGKLPPDVIANYRIRTVDGRSYTLGELRGKVVVLDFFAIWCGHSRHHIPSMTEFGEKEKQKGLQIIGLAVNDAESTPQRVKKFMDEMHIEYPVGMISDPEFAKYVDSRDVSVPQTLVYGRDGRLIAHFSGHNNASEKELADVVERELGKQ